MIDKEVEYTKMAAAEKDLWWYQVLHAQVLSTFRKKQLPKNAAILDAGCGTGGLMEKLQNSGYHNLKGIDLSEDAVRFCQEKQLSVVHDDVRNIGKHYSPNSMDVIVSNDVLCYFKGEEQLSLISDMLTVLKDDGLLIMNLPALKAFGGIHDLSVGIQHRFNKRDLTRITALKGIKIVSKRYWPFFLSPLIYGVRFNQRLKLKLQKDVAIESDVFVPAKPINNLLVNITLLELKTSPFSPFGSSLFTVFQKDSQ